MNPGSPLDQFFSNQPLGRATLEPEEILRICASAIASSAVAIVFVGADNRASLANRAFVQLAGYDDAAEIVGRLISEFTSEPEVLGDAIQRARLNGQCQAEVIGKRRDGGLIRAHLSAALVKDSEGKPLCTMASFTDVTDRKRTEDALRKSEARFRAVIETEPECVKIVAADGRLEEMNPAGLAMLEVDSLEGARSCPLIEWVAPEHQAAFLQLHHRVISGGSDTLEFEVVGAKGTRRWLETRAVPLRDEHGKVASFLGVTRDITERKRTESLLAGQKQVLEMIASGASLNETLTTLLQLVESQVQEMVSSILLLDEDGIHLRHAAAPSLPHSFINEIDGQSIGPAVGSCGTAAFRREAVFVEDIAVDPLWAGYRDLALRHGLRACWSIPIFDVQRQVLGLFAIYYRRPSLPESLHLRLIELVTHTAAICLSRERAENTLRHAESKYRALFENSIGGIYQTTPDGRFLTANPALAQILGYTSPEELIRQRTDISQQGYVNPAIREEFKRRLEIHGFVRGFECEVYRKDGSRIWVSENARMVRDALGRAAFFEGTLVDVTERKEAVEKLRQSESSLAKAQRMAHLGSWELDLPRGDLRWSDETFEIFGLNPRAFTPTREAFINLVYPDDRERVQRMVQEAVEKRQPYALEHRILRPDGSIRFVSEHADQEIDPADQSVRLIGTVLDITQLKQAEMALQNSERHFRSLIENAQDLITSLDVQGTIHFQSPSIYRLLGYSPSEVIGRNVFEFIHPQDIGPARAALARAYESPDRPIAIEYRFRNASGAWRAIESIGRVLRREESSLPLVVVNSRDLTERKLLEEQLLQSQKMEAIGQLAGGVAHDFNNLLTVIQGHSSLLLSGGNLGGEETEFARQISLTAERAAALTRQLLLFGRKQVMQPRDIDLSEVVANVSKMLYRVLGEDIKLHLETEASLPLVHADPGMIEQILLNFAVNSRDAMPKGGRLIIRTHAAEIPEEFVLQNPKARIGRFVCLTVSDSGCGIAPEHVARIFEPFFTTKEVGKGTGLGLATVYGIVQQHQGWIQVHSEIGRGTSFDVYLPAIFRSPTSRDWPAPDTKPRGGSETILVAEDEKEVRNLARIILERFGYKVLEARDGPEALRVWAEHKARIDLLLTDIIMPDGLTGRELAEKIRTDKRDLPVIYTSGYSPDIFGAGVVLEEGINFLQKPYNPQELARAVRRCLDE